MQQLSENPVSLEAKHTYRWEWARLTALLLVLFSLGGYWMSNERASTSARERQRLEAQARVIEQNIERQLVQCCTLSGT